MEARGKKGAGTCMMSRVKLPTCSPFSRVDFIISIFCSSFSSGTEAGIRLYLDEIVSITCPALTSQAWATRAQAAVTISAVAQKLGKDVACYEF